MMKTKNIITMLSSVVLSMQLYGGTYDYNYSPFEADLKSEKKDPFVYGNFEKIVRFEALNFTDLVMDSKGNATLDAIIQRVQSELNASTEGNITVIGHAAYEGGDYSAQNAQAVADRLIENGVNKNIITVESRGIKDLAYSYATDQGKELSNRVMVTLYIPAKIVEEPKVEPKKESVIVTLRINFATDSAEITSEWIPLVQEFSDFLQENPQVKVEIIGHTDNVGREDENLDLSVRRALSVKKSLQEDGIASERLSFSGMGESAPVADNNTSEGRRLNRRIEVKLMGLEK